MLDADPLAVQTDDELADASDAAGANLAGPSVWPGRQDDLVRVNADMVKSITDEFATVMESAATLLRVADGAGLPARQPLVLAQPDDVEQLDEDEEDEQRNAGGFDLGGVSRPDDADVLDGHGAAQSIQRER